MFCSRPNAEDGRENYSSWFRLQMTINLDPSVPCKETIEMEIKQLGRKHHRTP